MAMRCMTMQGVSVSLGEHCDSTSFVLFLATTVGANI